MAEDEGAPDTLTPSANGGDNLPQVGVLAQYVKDFSFENPNAPQALMQGQQPQINIQINVSAKPMSDTDIEVALKLDGRAQNGETLLFGFELDFAGVFRVTNVPQGVEAPRWFPDSRRITSPGVSPCDATSSTSVERPLSTAAPNTAAEADPASKFSTRPRSV